MYGGRLQELPQHLHGGLGTGEEKEIQKGLINMKKKKI